jgi:hypothetical protein
MAVPVLVFVSLQRYFVRGLTAGTVGGWNASVAGAARGPSGLLSVWIPWVEMRNGGEAA